MDHLKPIRKIFNNKKFVKVSIFEHTDDPEIYRKSLRRKFHKQRDSIKSLIINKNPNAYAHGVRIGPFINNILNHLQQIVEASASNERKLVLLLHLRDSDILRDVAQVTHPKLYPSLDTILSSQRLTSLHKKSYDQPVPDWYPQYLQTKLRQDSTDQEVMHVDTGFRGSIIDWMDKPHEEYGLTGDYPSTTPKAQFVRHAPGLPSQEGPWQMQFEGKEKFKGNLDRHLLEWIENIPHELQEIGFNMNEVGYKNENIDAYYAVVFGCTDAIQGTPDDQALWHAETDEINSYNQPSTLGGSGTKIIPPYIKHPHKYRILENLIAQGQIQQVLDKMQDIQKSDNTWAVLELALKYDQPELFEQFLAQAQPLELAPALAIAIQQENWPLANRLAELGAPAFALLGKKHYKISREEALDLIKKVPALEEQLNMFI
jgi:hypothetical protein